MSDDRELYVEKIMDAVNEYANQAFSCLPCAECETRADDNKFLWRLVKALLKNRDGGPEFLEQVKAQLCIDPVEEDA